MEWLCCCCVFEVYVTEKIVVETDVALEAKLTLYVELTTLDIADYASTAEIVLLLQFLSSGNGETIEDYR